MCFWFVNSNIFRWLRVPVLWSIVFLVGCLYIFHYKATMTNRDFVIDYSDKQIRTSNRMLRLAQELYSRSLNNVNKVNKNDNIDTSIPNGRSNEIKFNIINVSDADLFEELSEEISLYIKNNLSNGQRIARPSPNPIYDDGFESKSNKSRHQTPLVNKRKFIPNYEDIVTRYLSNMDLKSNLSGYAALPYPYRRWNVDWTIRHMGMYPKSLYSPPPGEYPEQRLPKAILIGAGKCGTRALVEFLNMNPFIVRANREVHYFDRNQSLDKGLSWYVQQMPLSYSNQITVEKSPSYLWSPVAMQEIYQLDKSMKLLVIVKDPVERVISQSIRTASSDFRNVFVERNGKGDYRMKSQYNTVQWSIYVKYLRWWMDTFSAKQIHVVEAKEMEENPAKEINKIENFLQVPSMIRESNFYFNKTKGFQCMRPIHMPDDVICLHAGKGRAHPKLEPELEKLMYDFFRPYNEELFSLLGRRFKWGPGDLE